MTQSPGWWRSAVALVLVCATAAAVAFGDQTEKLEGKVVIYAGEVEELQCPLSGRYDCLKWPTSLYKFKYREVCFESRFLSCSIGCNAIVAVEKDKHLTLFVVERDKLTMAEFSLYRCPSMF